jgi:glycosidase
MVKNLLILFTLLFFFSDIAAQVTTEPVFPSDNQPVTIIFDATKGNAGLKDFTGDVYAHTGVITDKSTSGGDWKYVKAPWGTADPSVKLTRDASNLNLYRITFTPRSYYNVPSSEKILKLAFVFRNADGTKEAKAAGNADIFVTIYETGYFVKFTNPVDTVLFADPNTSQTFSGEANSSSALSISINGNVVSQVTGTAISYSYTFPSSGDGVVTLTGNNGTVTSSKSIKYFIKNPSEVAEPPAGVKKGINYISSTSVTLVLEAPFKSFVYVIGDFNNWSPSSTYQMKKSADGKTFWLTITGLTSAQEYAFQYIVDGNIRVADPYTDKILDPSNDPYINTSSNTVYPNLKAYPSGKTQGIVSVLQTAQVPYTWTSATFTRPAKEKMVVYELLLRDFVGTHKFSTLSDTLTYLKKLGINAIELMPIMEYSGNESWGYNPIFYFAPDKYYGPKNDLKAFIDKAHSMGIAVILDMVLNQADYEFPYVKMYWGGAKPAANNPMFNQDATHPFSVFFDFNHESSYTKSFVDSVCRYWIQEYKMDGFRFDLSKGFTQKNSGGNVTTWGQYDASRVAIWKRIYDKIRSYDNSAYVILEHFADNSEETELANYGMMFWGNMNYSYKESLKGYPNSNTSFGWISYKDRGWNQPNVLGYMESHDEERLMVEMKNNGINTSGYNIKDEATALNRLKLGAVFFFPIPGPKMIWQFGELGYDYSINYCISDGTVNNNCRVGNKPIKWEYMSDINRGKVFDTYAALINLKTSQPAFSNPSDFVMSTSSAVRQIRLYHSSMDVNIIGNFGTTTGTINGGFSKTGKWYDYFSGDSITITNAEGQIALQPGEYHIYTSAKLPKPSPVITSREDEMEKTVFVYPNPSNSKISIYMYGLKGGTVSLLNSLGQTIGTVTARDDQEELDLASLKPGYYLLQIRTGKSMIVKRIIKQ